MNKKQNTCPALTPGSTIWLRKRRRVMLPQEKAALQGIMAKNGGNLLGDLAGNSISFASCISMQVAALVEEP